MKEEKVYTNISDLNFDDRKKVKKLVGELVDSFTRVQSEKDFQKEALSRVCEELNINKKIVSKVAKTSFKDSFDQNSDENKIFEDAYEELFRINNA